LKNLRHGRQECLRYFAQKICKPDLHARLPTVMSALSHSLHLSPHHRTNTTLTAIAERPARDPQVFGAPASRADFPETRITWLPSSQTLRSSEWLIYVVDECPGLAELAKSILEVEGFSARAFNNRLRAWQAFVYAHQRPALIVTDDLGGDLAGIELIRRCRTMEPNLKTLWVSHRHPSNLTRRERALLDGFQPRPYCNPLLVDAVWRLCGPRSGWNYLRSNG